MSKDVEILPLFYLGVISWNKQTTETSHFVVLAEKLILVYTNVLQKDVEQTRFTPYSGIISWLRTFPGRFCPFPQ